MLILGIETSCDETAAALVEDGVRVRAGVVRSQNALHEPYRGVVPEIACRAHLADLVPIIEQTLREGGATLDDIDAVAVVHMPGLIGALLIGLTTAKTLTWLIDKPLIGVNHLHAHACAASLGRETPVFPCVSLVISGGHTNLFYSRDPLTHELLGATTDDAAGEAFDKVAAILGLGYPGGPAIDRAARDGDARAIAFPRTRLGPSSLDFSFSGLKTAVLYHCHGQNAAQAETRTLSDRERADVAASFQEAVVDVLVERAMEAAQRTSAARIVIGGGVACNSRLRERLQRAAAAAGVELIMPPAAFCLDNAAMVAGLAFHLHQRGQDADLYLDARARADVWRAEQRKDDA